MGIRRLRALKRSLGLALARLALRGRQPVDRAVADRRPVPDGSVETLGVGRLDLALRARRRAVGRFHVGREGAEHAGDRRDVVVASAGLEAGELGGQLAGLLAQLRWTPALG